MNERAPGASDARWKSLFEATLGDHVEVTEVRVKDFEQAYAAARGAAAWNVDLVASIGGDGTANACMNGLFGSRTRLAVIPAGTANDLARILEQHGDPLTDAVAMSDWQRRDIDAIGVNGTRYYSAGGLGFVATTADTANRWRATGRVRRWLLQRVGALIYTIACIAVLAFTRRLRNRYTIDYTDAADGRRKQVSFDGFGVIVANCDRVGSSFLLDPSAEIDDGQIELVLFQQQSRLALLRAMVAARCGRLLSLPGVESLSVTNAQIETDEAELYFGDGEILDRGHRFEILVEDTPVRLMAPAPVRTPAVGFGRAVAEAM